MEFCWMSVSGQWYFWRNFIVLTSLTGTQLKLRTSMREIGDPPKILISKWGSHHRRGPFPLSTCLDRILCRVSQPFSLTSLTRAIQYCHLLLAVEYCHLLLALSLISLMGAIIFWRMTLIHLEYRRLSKSANVTISTSTTMATICLLLWKRNLNAYSNCLQGK